MKLHLDKWAFVIAIASMAMHVGGWALGFGSGGSVGEVTCSKLTVVDDAGRPRVEVRVGSFRPSSGGELVVLSEAGGVIARIGVSHYTETGRVEVSRAGRPPVATLGVSKAGAGIISVNDARGEPRVVASVEASDNPDIASLLGPGLIELFVGDGELVGKVKTE